MDDIRLLSSRTAKEWRAWPTVHTEVQNPPQHIWAKLEYQTLKF